MERELVQEWVDELNDTLPGVIDRSYLGPYEGMDDGLWHEYSFVPGSVEVLGTRFGCYQDIDTGRCWKDVTAIDVGYTVSSGIWEGEVGRFYRDKKFACLSLLFGEIIYDDLFFDAILSA